VLTVVSVSDRFQFLSALAHGHLEHLKLLISQEDSLGAHGVWSLRLCLGPLCVDRPRDALEFAERPSLDAVRAAHLAQFKTLQ